MEINPTTSFSCTFPSTAEDVMAQIKELAKESDEDCRTIFAEDMYGHYIPVAEIKRVENCPKELFNEVINQLIKNG